MSTFDDRIRAVRELARASGKSVDAVLGTVAKTWHLDAFEFGALLTEARKSGPANDPAVAKAVRERANETAHDAELDRKAADVLAFRDYQRLRRENPFAAARLMEADLASIERGRALDEQTDDGPQAA